MGDDNDTPDRLEIGETVTVNGREFVAVEVIHEDDAVRVVDLKLDDEQ